MVRLAAGLEEVVPVVSGRAETFDNRMQSDHRGGHGVAGGVGVEAAADLAGMLQQGLEPKRIGSGTGSRKTPGLGIQSKATEGVDSRFTKDNRASGILGAGGTLDRNGEEAEVLLGTGCQATPGTCGGAAQFSANGQLFLSE